MFASWTLLSYVKISMPFILYVALLIGMNKFIERVPTLNQPANRRIVSLFKSTIHLLIIILSALMVLNIAGIDIQGIVAGLGLMSFAIGLALKDVITSMLSSYALLLYKPFSVGDEISVKGITGIVSKMDTRYTTLESDQETYLLPNAEIVSSIIVLKKKFSRDLAQIKA